MSTIRILVSVTIALMFISNTEAQVLSKTPKDQQEQSADRTPTGELIQRPLPVPILVWNQDSCLPRTTVLERIPEGAQRVRCAREIIARDQSQRRIDELLRRNSESSQRPTTGNRTTNPLPNHPAQGAGENFQRLGRGLLDRIEPVVRRGQPAGGPYVPTEAPRVPPNARSEACAVSDISRLCPAN